MIDAVRTALTAATGTGGAAALLLAFRRQRHTEHAALETRHAAEVDRAQREVEARTVAEDAAARRVTELYARAVDQLGNEKAPVRLGGLYALERLPQDSPGQRQTIVNVLCAYRACPTARSSRRVATVTILLRTSRRPRRGTRGASARTRNGRYT